MFSRQTAVTWSDAIAQRPHSGPHGSRHASHSRSREPEVLLCHFPLWTAESHLFTTSVHPGRQGTSLSSRGLQQLGLLGTGGSRTIATLAPLSAVNFLQNAGLGAKVLCNKSQKTGDACPARRHLSQPIAGCLQLPVHAHGHHRRHGTWLRRSCTWCSSGDTARAYQFRARHDQPGATLGP